MPIACIGTIVEVTPGDEIQIIHAGGHEFIDDREPFRVRVDEVMREDGVVGAVVGPARMPPMVASMSASDRAEDAAGAARGAAGLLPGAGHARRAQMRAEAAAAAREK